MLHRLLTSCFERRPDKKVNLYKAPTNNRHAPHNVGSDGHAPFQPSNSICTEGKQPPSLLEDPPWESLFLEATPFSSAVVSSDAKEVLFKRRGLEPAAAQLLDQAMLFNSASHPLNAPLASKTGSLPTHGCDTCSFLTALLGPELEAVAVKKARQDRLWRGTISAQLPVQRGASRVEGTSIGCGSSSACPDPPGTLSEPKNTNQGCSTSSREPDMLKKKASLLLESTNAEMGQVPHEGTPPAAATAATLSAPGAAVLRRRSPSLESVQSKGTPAILPTATAAVAKRRGSAPGQPVQCEGTSSVPAGWRRSAPAEICSADPRFSRGSRGTSRSAIKYHASLDAPSERLEDSSKRVHWVCPGADLEDITMMSSPSPHVKDSVFTNSMLSQSSSQASLHNPLTSAPVRESAQAQQSSIRKSKSCLQRQRCELLAGEQGEGEEKREEEMQSPSSLSRASSSKSRHLSRESKSMLNRHPSFSRRSSLLLTSEAAIEQLQQGGGSEESATRTVAFLKSISKRIRNEVPCSVSLVCKASRDSEDRSVPPSASDSQQHEDQIDAGLASLSYASVLSMPPRMSQTSRTSGQPSTVSGTSNGAHTIAQSSAALSPLQKAHGDMQVAGPIVSVSLSPSATSLESGAKGCSPHSIEGAHDLYQPTATDSAEHRGHMPKPSLFARMSQKPCCSAVQGLDVLPEDSIKDCANPTSQELLFPFEANLQQESLAESPMPPEDPHWPGSEANPLACLQEPAERTSQSSSEDELPTQSFDVMVTTLSEDPKSPLLVSIFNCSEHWQVRVTLTTLAEAQLELLSSLMPHHAIQFLAMESTDAVPEHVGQLARAHSDVTLMFMDIVGFTSMSKNVKPVEVMVFLNKLFSLFDRLTDVHKVHKIETAGDCYIVGGGIVSPDQCANGFRFVTENQDPTESAKQVMDFAKALLEAAEQVMMPDTNKPVCVRVGLHTGDVVSGLIGSKMPKFSIFGDTMNTASRMESTGVPGRIHVSETTQRLLMHESWESTGGVEVKGKGQMQTYLWVPPASSMPGVQQQVQSTLAGSPVDPLPCSFIKQAQQAHTLLKHLGRFNNEVFMAEPLCQQ